jgi:hypothetical protein
MHTQHSILQFRATQRGQAFPQERPGMSDQYRILRGCPRGDHDLCSSLGKIWISMPHKILGRKGER